MTMKIGAVLLAAGRGERFGSNKLLVPFCGRPMICRALDHVQALPLDRRCVIAGSDEVEALAKTYGFDVIRNAAQELGQSHSIVLGVSAMQDMDAVLLMVADQPCLSLASLAHLLDVFSASDKGMACLQDGTHRGNPAVFSAKYIPALLALTGDRGAKGILRAHEDDLLIVDCLREGELGDADTPQALEILTEKYER